MSGAEGEGRRPEVAPMETALDAASILAEATRRTDLDDFGDPSFREPMQRLLAAMEQEAGLHEVGRATQRERVIGLLVNRLRGEAAYAHHPEIADEVIERPVVIVGLARTGTTMLHRMLAANPAFLSLRWWESRHPAPFDVDERAAATDPRITAADPRITAAEEEVRAICKAAPELVAAHPMDAHAPDEEIMLLEHSFFSTNAEAYVDVPSFSRWLDAQDQRPGYAYLARLLRLVQWQKHRRGEPGRRWVLKTPHHLGFMDLLFETFPDAFVIQTHRDPVQTIPSLASLVHAIRATGTDTVDAHALGRHWSDRMRRALEACMDHRARHPERFMDLDYRALVEDPMAAVARIHAFIDEPLPASARRSMLAWAEENARDRRPIHHYTLDRFGLSEAGLARDFRRYRTTFLADVASEGPDTTRAKP